MRNIFNQISNDIIKYNVYPYLTIRDKIVLNLSGVKPKFDINLEFNHCIKSRLQKLGLTCETINTLLQKMKEDKALISGSFILQCIHNETYADSDINIYNLHTKRFRIDPHQFDTYTKYARNVTNADILAHMNYTYRDFNPNNKSIFEYLNSFEYMDDYDENDENDKKIFKSVISIDLKKNDAMFNYVELKGSIYKTIETDFGLDFCKCTYDGEKLRIYDIQSVINKKAVFNLSKTIDKIQLLKSTQNMTYDEIKTMVLKRIDKYLKRQYKIDIVETTNVIRSRDKKIIDKRRKIYLLEFEYLLLPIGRTGVIPYIKFIEILRQQMTPAKCKKIYVGEDFVNSSKKILYKIHHRANQIYTNQILFKRNNYRLSNDDELQFLLDQLFSNDSYKN